MSTHKREYLAVFEDWLTWFLSCLSQIKNASVDGNDAELATLIRKLSAEGAGLAAKLPKIREEFEELQKADPEAATRICTKLWLAVTGRTMPMHKSQLLAEAIELGLPADSVDRLAVEDIIAYVIKKEVERYLIREPLQRCAIEAGIPVEKIAAIEDPMLLAAYLEKMPAAAETGQRQGQDAGNTQPPECAGPPRALMIYSPKLAKDLIGQIDEIIADENKTVEEKLRQINKILPIPLETSQRALADALGVTPAAIQKTKWWQENRAGAADEDAENRRANAQARGRLYEGR